MNELVKGILLPDTKLKLGEIMDAMLLRNNMDGFILAGTELPLILTAPSHKGFPLLDTTRLHVQRIVETMLT
jgi:aspartate racemase